MQERRGSVQVAGLTTLAKYARIAARPASGARSGVDALLLERGVAIERRQEEVALVAEGAVEALPTHAESLLQVAHGGFLVALRPEELGGTVEHRSMSNSLGRAMTPTHLVIVDRSVKYPPSRPRNVMYRSGANEYTSGQLMDLYLTSLALGGVGLAAMAVSGLAHHGHDGSSVHGAHAHGHAGHGPGMVTHAGATPITWASHSAAATAHATDPRLVDTCWPWCLRAPVQPLPRFRDRGRRAARPSCAARCCLRAPSRAPCCSSASWWGRSGSS